MNTAELQLLLRDTGRYTGKIDHIWGQKTTDAVLLAFTDGPDTKLTKADYLASAARLHCPVANIMAVAKVEAAGAGFEDGKPKILFEPHRFSKLTKGKYDGIYPELSYPKWGTRPYPKTQELRYAQLVAAMKLDFEAALKATSWGKFQILGENHLACGYDTVVGFAFSMAMDEIKQLQAFEKFITKNGLLPFLQNGIWTSLAKGYNGPAYRENRYDVKLATEARNFERFPDRMA